MLRPRVDNHLRVIRVKQRTGDRIIEKKQSGPGYREETITTEKGVDTTIALVMKNGELFTKEFNGHWDLEDIKSWEV